MFGNDFRLCYAGVKTIQTIRECKYYTTLRVESFELKKKPKQKKYTIDIYEMLGVSNVTLVQCLQKTRVCY